MKKLILSWLLGVLFLSATIAQRGTNRTGYEGDYFSLEGAIELFQQSNSIRDFERKINTEDNWVNNLDLNYDGRIDYIRVEHRRQGDFHAIVLQVPIDRYNVQDVAVIEIEKTGRREAILQIVGDEDLYGEEIIVEPFEGKGYSSDRGGPNVDYGFRRGFVNVYWWTPVQHIFGRRYQVYVSPFSWRYYPSWWSPWRPCAWNVFQPRVIVYHTHYHRVHHHRVARVHHFYKPNRAYCPRVAQRSNKVRIKHGKAPIHRKPAKEKKKKNGPISRNKKFEKKQNTSSSRNKGNQRGTITNKPRSKNEVKQRSKNKSRTQGADTKAKQGSSSRGSSNTQRSTSKANKQGNSRNRINTTKGSTNSRSTTTHKTKKSQQRTNSSKKSVPSSGSKVSRNKAKSTVSRRSKRGN
jgi:hypothetical protein